MGQRCPVPVPGSPGHGLPASVRYAMPTFTPVDVMRFTRPTGAGQRQSPHACRHEISSNIKERREGVRDQALAQQQLPEGLRQGFGAACGDVDPRSGDFKVYRPLEGDPQVLRSGSPMQGSATCRVGPRSARRPTSAYLGKRPQSRTRHRCGNWSSRCAGNPAPTCAHRPSPAAPPTESAAEGDGSARVRRGPTCRRPRVPRFGRWFHAGPRFPRPASAARQDPRRHRRPDGSRVGIGERWGRVGVGGPTRPAPGARRPKGWRWAPAGAGSAQTRWRPATRPCWRR